MKKMTLANLIQNNFCDLKGGGLFPLKLKEVRLHPLGLSHKNQHDAMS